MRKKVFNMMVLTGVTVLLMSCLREPVYEPLSGLYLKLDVQLGPSTPLTGEVDLSSDPALYAKMMSKEPEKVRVCFYDVNSHYLVAEDFLPPTGGYVNVPAGDYDIVAYGLGTEITSVEGTETRAGSYAHTEYVGSKVRVTTKTEENEPILIDYPVISEPDHLFVGRAEGIHVPFHSSDEETIVVEMTLSTLLESYTFEVLNVFNGDRIQNMDVYVTGQAAMRYLWDGRQSAAPCAITFDAKVDTEEGCIKTAFNTFARLPATKNQVFLNVLIFDVQGSRYQWVYDVTDQFENPDNTEHRIIITDRIEIPDGMTGGLSPDVNDWDAVIEVVPLS